MNRLLTLAAMLLAVFVTACSEKSTETPPLIDATNNGYESKAVAEILVKNCAVSGCHASETESSHGLVLTTWAAMTEGSILRHLSSDTSGHGHGKRSSVLHTTGYGGEAVIPFFPEKSLLYRLITGAVADSTQRMPYMLPKLSEADVSVIRNWILNGARDYQGRLPFYGTGSDVYVACQGADKIYVLNTAKNVISRIIDVDQSTAVTDQPHNLQIAGGYLYVSLITAGKFIKVNLQTLQVTAAVNGLQYPGMVELSPDGSTAYVSKSSTAPGEYNVIYKIDTQTMQLTASFLLPVLGIPHGIALSPDGGTLVVANMTKDRITFLNTSTGDVIGNEVALSSGAATVHEPMHIYISPDGAFLYASCRKSNAILVLDMQTRAVVQQIPLTDHPMQMAVSKDGNRLYAVLMHEQKVVQLVKTGTSWAVAAVITHPAMSMLYGASLSADGKYLYVTSSNQDNAYKPRYAAPGILRPSNIIVIETTGNTVLKVVDVDAFATGVTAR